MASTFSLASDTSLAYSPLHIVVPFEVEDDATFDSICKALKQPLPLLTPAKKLKPFDIEHVMEKITLNKDGDVPVIEILFSVEGWDQLAYRFLKDMAHEVKTNPKGMPRSYRSYANLMQKLTQHPTGNGKNDNARKVVIDRAVEQLAEGLRDQLVSRVQTYDKMEGTIQRVMAEESQQTQ